MRYTVPGSYQMNAYTVVRGYCTCSELVSRSANYQDSCMRETDMNERATSFVTCTHAPYPDGCSLPMEAARFRDSCGRLESSLWFPDTANPRGRTSCGPIYNGLHA